MKKLNITYDEMIQSSSLHTLSEIHQQPATWEKTIAQIKREKKQIDEFISKVTSQEDFDIVLTGAGTSEFVGNALFSYLNRVNKYKVKSYGTTDLVSSPENYLSATKPTLLVSFARSGNSPESVGASMLQKLYAVMYIICLLLVIKMEHFRNLQLKKKIVMQFI